MKDYYWFARQSAKRLINSEKNSLVFQKDIVKLYENAQREVNKLINGIYLKYSLETGLDVAELSQILTGGEKADFLRKVQKRMMNLGMNVDQVYNEKYLYQLSRLQAFKQQIYWEIMNIAPQEDLILKEGLTDIYLGNYTDARYNRAVGYGVAPTFNQLDRNLVYQVVLNKWEGGNYSTRVWNNVGKLAKQLPFLLGNQLSIGASQEKTARVIKDRFRVGKYNATRLVRTETNFIQNQSELRAMQDDGVEEYKYDAVMDGRTSEICSDLNGDVFKVTEAVVGVNYPPLHPNCRSGVVEVLKPLFP